MGRFVIVAFEPKPGKEDSLAAAIEKHYRVLHAENPETDKTPYLMRAEGGVVLEVFEWRSAKAIAEAHSNPAVQALWSEFENACEYVPLNSLDEAQQMFAEFEAIPS